MGRKSSPAGDQFIERLGLATEAEGLPRIAGRLMALLILESRPCSFDELAELLQVSPASVSTNTRLLESLGVIERVTRAGDRRAFFQLGIDPYGRLIEGSLSRMRRIAGIVEEAGRTLPRDMNGARQRLADMRRFYEITIRNTESTLREIRRGVPK
jgi:DNA-binding transcriptional regulator GbsR (MarR family)